MFLRTISKNIYFKISFFFGVNVEIGKQLTVNLCIQYEQKRTKKSYIISYEGITYIKIEKGKLYKSKQNTMARSSYRRCSIKKVFLKISINSQESLWHKCFPVNLSQFLRTPFLQNTSGRLLLNGLQKWVYSFNYHYLVSYQFHPNMSLHMQLVWRCYVTKVLLKIS